jgi:SAM-dependent methyltransferase
MKNLNALGLQCGRVKAYYDKKPETHRLGSPDGKLEYERSKAIISRYLSSTPMEILDVGGGTGAYSFWLAALGHRLSFIDLSDVHVANVKARNREINAGLIDIRQGNALSLGFPDKSFSIVLNMGPMYHLPPNERHTALLEMRRVLRDDGLIISSYISRFAALMDGYKESYINDPSYESLALGDVRHGTHDSPDEEKYFTLAFMHLPNEVKPELEASGFRALDLIAVEGFFWTYPLEQYVADLESFSQLLMHAELVEKEPSIMGASAHFLSIAVKNRTKKEA